MTLDPQQAKSLFLAALEKAGDERRAFLDEACAGDPELRGRLEQLLRAHERPDSLPAAPPVSGPTQDSVPREPHEPAVGSTPGAEWPGAVVGRYKLVERIGEGGMGAVWLAQQTEPVRRLVALKLIKGGLDSRQVVARFEAERQALALMDHPHIARVLDGGATAGGRPYFVMELVKGVPITRYCDEHRLTPRQRLELFLPVCHAIQHAHQKGIIHRDVKPSNVLVALYDGKPVPKVIDFGIAKAAGQPLTEQTLVTGFGCVVGTLEYMSPEQAELNQLDIDTRSDIYSLGVLLYELLTGSPPLDRKRLKEGALLEVLRIIREEEPPTPSNRLSTTDELPAVAANRGLEPRKLSSLVRGELEWIVMKALDKDRNRRYESANSFGQDIQRYLADEPVQACPPSGWYRFRKFAQRHRAGLLTTAAVLLVVLLAAGGVGWAWWDRAAQEAKRRLERAGRLAETERTVSVALARADQWASQAEGQAPATSKEAAAVLAVWAQADGAVAKAEAALQTGVSAERLRQSVADVQRRLKRGRRHAELMQAQALRKEKLLRALDDARLQRAILSGDSFDYAAAAAHYEAAFTAYGLKVKPGRTAALARRIRAQERAVREALLVALNDWAWAATVAHTEPAEATLRALALAADDDAWRKRFRVAGGSRDQKTLRYLSALARKASLPPSSLEQLALTLSLYCQRDDALALLRWARTQHPTDFWIHLHLGNFLIEAKERTPPLDLEEAIGCNRTALALRPDASVAHYNLGVTLGYKGQWDEAIAAYRGSICLKKDFAGAHYNLGIALEKTGRLDDAMAAYREAIRLKKDFAHAHCNLGNLLAKKGQLDEAIAEFRQALHFKKDCAEAHCGLGLALAMRGKGQLDEAIAACREAIRLRKDYADAHLNLAVALDRNGQRDESIAAIRQAIRLKTDYAQAYANLGIALRDKGQPDEAIAAFREAIRLKKDFAEPRVDLGNALRRKGQPDKAIALYREAIRLKKDYALAYLNLGVALADKGQLDEAIAAYREAIRLKKDYALAYFDLGIVLEGKGRRDEAVALYRKAIRLKKDFAHAHIYLGNALRQQGEFRRALVELRRGHELGSRDPHWPFSSAQWVRQCERLVELDEKLPGFLSRTTMPASPEERIELAGLCSLKHLHRAAARFYEEAFAVQPKLSEGHRYNAACAAAQAGCGHGKDAAALDGRERARLRRQALDWLRAHLEAWTRVLQKHPDKGRAAVTKHFQEWLADPDLGGVRGPAALAKLPEAERQPWQKLWEDVAATLARAQRTTTPRRKSNPKENARLKAGRRIPDKTSGR